MTAAGERRWFPGRGMAPDDGHLARKDGADAQGAASQAAVPLLDTRTAAALTAAPGGPNGWQQIHVEINGARQEFEDSSPVCPHRRQPGRGGAEPAQAPRHPALGPHTTGQWRHALNAGEPALNGTNTMVIEPGVASPG